jgi:pimeloyl-ACP methyl ester carboxylesterase
MLHGFPELAYSWRKVMPALAEPDITSSRPTSAAMAARPAGAPITTTISAVPVLNAVRDALGLVAALGYRSVAAVMGHDFGPRSPRGARWCGRRVPLARADERALRRPAELPFASMARAGGARQPDDP